MNQCTWVGLDVHADSIVEFVSVPSDPRDAPHDSFVENENHEGFVGHAFPLTCDAATRCRLEAESRIVLGVSQHDHER